jgi:hypothetical protein
MTQADPAPTAIALNDAMHDWVVGVGGPDPRKFPAVLARATDPVPPAVPPAIPPPAIPPPAVPPAAVAPAAPPTPEQARADFERRFTANKALYDKVGQEVADSMLKPEDRLTPAELKIGRVTTDTTDSVKTDEKGRTWNTTTTTAQATLGPDGKPIELTRTQSSTTNVGLGNVTHTEASTVAHTANGTIETIARQQTFGVDAVAGQVTVGSSRSTETKAPTPEASGKTEDRTTVTAGMGGINRTVDHSTQTGSQLNSTSTTTGLSRSDGQLGATRSTTTTSGTMVGPADKQVMDKGTETTVATTGGLVSDDKGTGVGLNRSEAEKTNLGHGVSLTNTVAAGGRCQALVAEVPNSDPPQFTITTTISFNVSVAVGGGGEAAPKATPAEDGRGLADAKASISVGANAAMARSASFKHTLPADQAQKYLDDLKADGRGSKLPEHQILATGASQGWEAAQKLWAAMQGSTEAAKALKPGEELQTTAEDTAGVKGAVGGGESRQGGLALGVNASASATHRVTVKKAGMPDGKIQITATIEDESADAKGASAGIGMASMTAGISHGEGKGRVVVFLIDPKDPAFDGVVKAIDAAQTAAQIDAIAAQNHKLLASTTTKTSSSDGQTVGAAVGPVSVDLGGKGTMSDAVTRDADGHVIGSQTTGTNTGGGTIGVKDIKVGDSVTTSFAGQVDKDNHATGEIGTTKKSTSVLKTMQNLANAGHDPLGTALHPGGVVADDVDTKGIAIADAETMSYVNAALDRTAWNNKVVGHRHDDWVACGTAIRAAVTFADGKITNVDKHAVQQALAAWSKADDSGNTDALDSVIRPLGGVPTGKAFAFPDGTAQFKPDWDALVIADPLADARALAAAKKPQEALAAMQKVRAQVQSLANGINSAAHAWADAGSEVQHAEMMGHINTRIADIDKAIHDLARALPPPPKPAAAPAAGAGADAAPPAPTEAELKAQEAKARADAINQELIPYNNNIDVMKGYSDSVFQKLGSIEAKLNGWFASVADAVQPLKEVEDLIKIWDALYWPTFQIFEKYQTMLDRSRIEKLHTAGARGRWKQVYDRTRDTSMAGRE